MTVTSTETAPTAVGLRVLQRVVFPGEDLDVVPLYVETNFERGAAELAAELATEALTGSKASRSSVPVANAAVGEAQSSIRFGADIPGSPGRGSRAAAQRGDQRGPPGLVRHLLQRVPGQLLAPLDHGRHR